MKPVLAFSRRDLDGELSVYVDDNHTGREPGHQAVAERMRWMLRRLSGRRGVHHVILGAANLDGEWSWGGASGAARPDTPWFLASVTKAYIASVVLRPHEQGLIDLNAPLLPLRLASGLHVIHGIDRTGSLLGSRGRGSLGCDRRPGSDVAIRWGCGAH